MRKITPPGRLKKETTLTIPSWVRAGAVADVDFVAEPPRAYAGGVEVSLADILGNSALLNASFDPASIVSGVGQQGSRFAMIGTLREALIGDFTLVMEFDDYANFESTEETFAADLVFSYGPAPVTTTFSSMGGGFVSPPNGGNGALGSHGAAITVNGTAGYASIDGVRLDDNDAPLTQFPVNRDTVPTDIVTGSGGTLKRMTVYAVKSEEEARLLTAA